MRAFVRRLRDIFEALIPFLGGVPDPENLDGIRSRDVDDYVGWQCRYNPFASAFLPATFARFRKIAKSLDRVVDDPADTVCRRKAPISFDEMGDVL